MKICKGYTEEQVSTWLRTCSKCTHNKCDKCSIQKEIDEYNKKVITEL